MRKLIAVSRIDLNQIGSRDHSYIGNQGENKDPPSTYVSVSVKMKLTRIRHLLIVVVAVLLANNIAAASTARVVQPVMPAHAGTEAFDAGGGQPCVDADSTANCWAYCPQSYKIDEPAVSFNATPSTIAPVPPAYCAGFRPKPRRLVIVSAPPVVGPSLTILFGNFRI